VQPQFAAAIAADGAVAATAGTVGVTVTRRVVGGVTIVTVAPRE
jgi:hypothetical protein